jgi:hypothetical protein
MLWSPNCQLLYPFENQANDYSGNARHGTVFGSGVYATKPNGGRCLYFDGTGDYVATPSFGLSGTVVVFACQLRCRLSPANKQTLFGEDFGSATEGYFRCYRGSNRNNLVWTYADGVGEMTASHLTFFASPWDDRWLSLAVFCDYAGKKTYFYRDAVLLSTVAMSGTPVFPSHTRVKYVGAYWAGGEVLYDGNLAAVFLGTLATCPSVAALTANANRLMMGMNPIW